jgi:hypothetical protein
MKTTRLENKLARAGRLPSLRLGTLRFRKMWGREE